MCDSNSTTNVNAMSKNMGLYAVCVILLFCFVTTSVQSQETESSKSVTSTNVEAILVSARKLISRRSFDKAAAQLRQLVDQEPENAQGWQLLGYSLHAIGKIDEAIEAHQSATKFESTKALGHYNLACAYSLQNKASDALSHLEKAMDAGFDNINHIKNDSDLENVRSSNAYTELMAKLDSANEVYVCPPCGCATCGKKTFAEPGKCPDCNMTLVAKNKVMNVAIVIWQGVELLDFAGPGEVFAAAKAEDGRSFNVFTVSKSKQPIRSQGFLQVTPTYSLADCPKIDVLVLPGGGTSNVSGDAEFMSLLKEKVDGSEITLSVCTGASILGEFGYLDDLDVTTWHGAIDKMQAAYPQARFHSDRRFVDNGKFVTSAGVSAGIDSSLHLVARLYGKKTAIKTARYMEYYWRFAEDESAEKTD